MRRTVTGALTIMALAVLGLWIGTWQRDEVLYAKILGEGIAYETLAPAWPGAGQLSPSDLTAAARRNISAADLTGVRVWADVCAVFAAVPAPAAGKGFLNSRVLPPIAQGDGTFRAHEVILAREWTGWKLAYVRCGPVSQTGGKLIIN